MKQVAPPTSSSAPSRPDKTPAPRKRHRWWKRIFFTLLILGAVLCGVRLALPSWVRWYVNRTLDKSPVYQGTIGSVQIELLKGGYTIRDVQLNKTTENVPVPFFSAKRIDLHLQWDALLSGRIVGTVAMIRPELNFVDSKTDESASQSGSQGPWLQMIQDLFPFQINQCVIHNGSIHFRAFDTNPPVDVYLTQLEASIDDLSNIHNETKPLVTTVTASGLAMDTGQFSFQMKLDPFSYNPTFQLGLKLIGLDVTEINNLSRAYGDFDFERGYFDLIVELNSREGQLNGYVKPLFRNVSVFSLTKDAKKDNPLEYFWEALVGATTEVFKNQQKNQLATVIPLTGSLNGPQTNIFATVGNVLRNAFIRAYLPRYEGTAPDVDGLQFGRSSDSVPSEFNTQP